MSVMQFREPNEVMWRGVRPGHKGTQIAKSGQSTGNPTILHTVTVGKTLFLVHYNHSTYHTVAAFTADIYVRNGSDVTQYIISRLVEAVVGSMFVSGNFSPPLEIPEGWDVCVDTANINVATYAFIHGWEE